MERLPDWPDPGAYHPLRPLVMAYLQQRDVALTHDRLHDQLYTRTAIALGLSCSHTPDEGGAVHAAMSQHDRETYAAHGLRADAFGQAAAMLLRAMERAADNLGGW
jgi:hypothetical protein